MSSFISRLQGNYSLSIYSAEQNIFSKYYSLWLNSVILADESAQNWQEVNLSAQKRIAFEAGGYAVQINQNGAQAAPYLDSGDGSTSDFEARFEGDEDGLACRRGRFAQARDGFGNIVAPGAAYRPAAGGISLEALGGAF